MSNGSDNCSALCAVDPAGSLTKNEDMSQVLELDDVFRLMRGFLRFGSLSTGTGFGCGWFGWRADGGGGLGRHLVGCCGRLLLEIHGLDSLCNSATLAWCGFDMDYGMSMDGYLFCFV